MNHLVGFVATLSNNSVVMQTDRKSWLDLKRYLSENPHISIRQLYLRKGTSIFMVGPTDADGYFFAYKAFTVIGTDRILDCVSAGFVKDNLVYKRILPIVEFKVWKNEVKPVDKCGNFVIMNKR